MQDCHCILVTLGLVRGAHARETREANVEYIPRLIVSQSLAIGLY